MKLILVVVLGVLIGWCTKIPFFLNWYRDYERDKVKWFRERNLLCPKCLTPMVRGGAHTEETK